MDVPMGYIRKGKKIRVGKVNNQNNKIVRILIEGKIAYIQTKDIAPVKLKNAERSKVHEHNVDYSFLDKTAQNAKHNSAYLLMGTGQSGPDWAKLSDFMDDTNTGNIKAYSVDLIHHPKDNKFFVGVGVEYLTIDQRSVKLNSLLGKISGYYELHRLDWLSVQARGSILFSGDVQVDSAFNIEPSRGLALGASASIFARFYPDSQFGALVGVFTRKINLSQLEPIINKDGEEYRLTSLSGTSLYAGLTYHFK